MSRRTRVQTLTMWRAAIRLRATRTPPIPQARGGLRRRPTVTRCLLESVGRSMRFVLRWFRFVKIRILFRKKLGECDGTIHVVSVTKRISQAVEVGIKALPDSSVLLPSRSYGLWNCLLWCYMWILDGEISVSGSWFFFFLFFFLFSFMRTLERH